MIIRARAVVTMNGTPIDNGAVTVSADRIVDVGTFDHIKKRNIGNTIDLGEQALLPGLINAHCHLDYTCLRGKIPPQRFFTDWIRAINAEKSDLSPKDYLASIIHGFDEAKKFGTTAMVNLTAFPELVPQIQAPIRTCWFAELIDIRAPERATELLDSAIGALRRSMDCADMSALSKRRHVAVQKFACGLAPHALFTASDRLFCHCEGISQRDDILLTTHLAESRAEMEMFRDGSGPLYEFLKSIGRPMDDCGSKTPLELFLAVLGHQALPHWIVAHLNELTDSDFDLLEELNRKFHVVHCPRSHTYFDHTPFEFDRLRSFGFNICLGTDSLATNDSLSLFAEMRAFQSKFPSVSAEEILQMATVNPARALQQENVLGTIRNGAWADFIAVPFNGGNLFEQIIAFTGEPWMMIAGRVQ